MTQKTLDPNFVDALTILTDTGVRFWVSEGTLLGLIRDGALIEWDADIDVSVFADDNALPAIAQAFTSAGFEVSANLLRRPWEQGLKITRPGGRVIDVSEYSRDRIDGQEVWTRQWYASDRNPPKTLGKKIPYHFLRLLHHLALMSRPRSEVFTRSPKGLSGLIAALHDRLGRWWGFDDRFGYFIPAALLVDFDTVSVAGVSCPVPRDAEAVLYHLYGDGWSTPTPSKHWTEYFISGPRAEPLTGL